MIEQAVSRLSRSVPLSSTNSCVSPTCTDPRCALLMTGGMLRVSPAASTRWGKRGKPAMMGPNSTPLGCLERISRRVMGLSKSRGTKEVLSGSAALKCTGNRTLSPRITPMAMELRLRP